MDMNAAIVSGFGPVNQRTGLARVSIMRGVARDSSVPGVRVARERPTPVRLDPPEPFDVFYRRELVGIIALARALCGPALADDIAQEAMLAVYRRWDEVALLDLPVAWVRRVTVNLATSGLRRRAAEARALLRLGARRADYSDLDPAHEDFWADVRRLPRRQAQVAALHYVDDLSVADVAGVLGCSEGTVKQHLARARKSLAGPARTWTEQ
jgi:RNA polymerase sigma factor (sigma-70 family)